MGLNKSIVIKFIITTLVVILISGIFYSSSSYAMGEVISGGKDFLSAGSAATTVIKQDQLKSTSNYIYNTLLAVAIVVAVIVAMVLGIQFMAASADEKAKVKEALIPFVVGCIVVFGSFTIWKVAVNIGNKTEGSIVEETGFSDAMEASKATSDITDGKLDINTLSKQHIRQLYSNNRISSELHDKMYGTAYRPKKEEDYKTLEEALNEIGDTARQIYYKALDYELLREDEYGNKIYLINE